MNYNYSFIYLRVRDVQGKVIDWSRLMVAPALTADSIMVCHRPTGLVGA